MEFPNLRRRGPLHSAIGDLHRLFSFIGENLLAIRQRLDLHLLLATSTHAGVIFIIVPFVMALSFIPNLKSLSLVMFLAPHRSSWCCSWSWRWWETLQSSRGLWEISWRNSPPESFFMRFLTVHDYSRGTNMLVKYYIFLRSVQIWVLPQNRPTWNWRKQTGQLQESKIVAPWVNISDCSFRSSPGTGVR